MEVSAANTLRVAGGVLASVLVVLPSAWGTVAIWYQAPGGHTLKFFYILLWAALTAGVLVCLWQGRTLTGVCAFALAFSGLLVWWHLVTPSNGRPWADDVDRLATGTVVGDRATLDSVRNFVWRGAEDYVPRWEKRIYDLRQVRSVDMIMSYWRGPSIAHMLVSFGFEDGAQVVFSVEVRREKGEAFSELGGFFKEFELAIIAADEDDIIRLRTNIRGEDDFLYRLIMPRADMRALFAGYVDQANGLVTAPRYYNTLTANCTTLVYHMMKRLVGNLPFDYRILLTGYLPQYVYRIGGLDRRYTLEKLRDLGHITERARLADRSRTFSVDIRQGIPALPPSD